MKQPFRERVERVAVEMLKNPLQTQRELAKATDMPISAAHHALQEVKSGQTKDPRILLLTDNDFEIMRVIQQQKAARLSHKPEQINNADIDKWDISASRRFSLFRGELTDEGGGAREVIIKDYSTFVDEEEETQ